jgi:multisubunit Na+/H+ antiporter MnhC subunit
LKEQQKRIFMVRIAEQIQDSRLFSYILVAIVMSGYDAMATMQHIGRGVAAEANPLMDPLIHADAVTFFLVKMGLTVPCLILCYSYSHLRTARVGIRLAVGVYSVLCIYHALIALLIYK